MTGGALVTLSRNRHGISSSADRLKTCLLRSQVVRFEAVQAKVQIFFAEEQMRYHLVNITTEALKCTDVLAFLTETLETWGNIE